MKYVLIVLILLTASCATNEHDARIAIAKANVEIAEHNIVIEKERTHYAALEIANKVRPLVEMKGPWECKSEDCDFIVNNPFQKVVVPEREKGNTEVLIDGTVRLAKTLLPLGLAREAVNLADSIGRNSGHNTENNNSFNTSTPTTIDNSKTAQGDLVDAGSTVDKSIAVDESIKIEDSFKDQSQETDQSITVQDSFKDLSTVEQTDQSIKDAYNDQKQSSVDSNDDNSVTNPPPEPAP